MAGGVAAGDTADGPVDRPAGGVGGVDTSRAPTWPVGRAAEIRANPDKPGETEANG